MNNNLYFIQTLYNIVHQNYKIAKHWYSEFHASQVHISAVIYLIYIDFQYNEFTVFTLFHTPAGKMKHNYFLSIHITYFTDKKFQIECKLKFY